MDIEGEKTAVSGMLPVRLIRRPRRQDRPQSRFDLFQVALDGGADTILREQCVASAGILESLLSPQTKPQPITVVDLISHVFHEQEEVSEIVGVLASRPQIRFQHGVKGRLALRPPQPLHIADGFGRLSRHDNGQAMLPAEPV